VSKTSLTRGGGAQLAFARISAADLLARQAQALARDFALDASTAARRGLPACGSTAAASSRAASASVAPRARMPGRAGSRAT